MGRRDEALRASFNCHQMGRTWLSPGVASRLKRAVRGALNGQRAADRIERASQRIFPPPLREAMGTRTIILGSAPILSGSMKAGRRDASLTIGCAPSGSLSTSPVDRVNARESLRHSA